MSNFHDSPNDEPEALPKSKSRRDTTPDQDPFSWDDHFYGAVTVGERGQIVIPAAARKRFDIEPGDKLLIMGDPGKRSIMLCKMDALREFMTVFQEGLARVEQEMQTAVSANTASGTTNPDNEKPTKDAQ
jgi:AbrB family looped-hinge helix DNA binding protein